MSKANKQIFLVVFIGILVLGAFNIFKTKDIKKESTDNIVLNTEKGEVMKVINIDASSPDYTNVWLTPSPRIFTISKKVPNYSSYLSLMEYSKKSSTPLVFTFSKNDPNVIESVMVTKGAPESLASEEVKFSGIISAFSTACYADGICSITVDGKTVVTTEGWSQDVVGSVKGVKDFGQVEKKIGSKADVYALKVDGGYTLYGKKDYYIDIK